jgi:hypothetical protein
LAAWVNPQFSFTAGGGYGGTSAVCPAAKFTAIPDRPVKSLLLVADSIGRGYSSTDTIGDENYNFGFHERAIAGRCGTVNMAISSLLGSAMANYATNYPLTMALYAGATTHARVAIGINDITTGANSTQVTNYINIIANYLRTFGVQVGIGKFCPCVTSTDSMVTEANQTPKTGSAAGGVLDTVNQAIDAGTIVSDFTVCDPYSVVVGDTPFKWRTLDSTPAVPYIISGDGTHPSAYYGIVYLAKNGNIKASYAAIA